MSYNEKGIITTLIEYFSNWKDTSDSIPSTCEAVEDMFDGLRIPYNNCDKNKLSLRSEAKDLTFNLAHSTNDGGGFSVEAGGLLGELLELQFGSDLGVGWGLNVSSAKHCPSGFLNMEDSAVGSFHWDLKLSDGGEALSVGAKMGPMGFNASLPADYISSGQARILSTELSATFNLSSFGEENQDCKEDSCNAKLSVKKEGNDVTGYMHSASTASDIEYALAVAHGLNRPGTELALSVKNNVPVLGNFEAGVLLCTNDLSKSFQSLQHHADNSETGNVTCVQLKKEFNWFGSLLPVEVTLGIDTKQRKGAAFAFHPGGDRSFTVSVDQEDKSPFKFGFVVNC